MGHMRGMTFDVNIASPWSRWGGVNPIARAVVLADEVGYFAVVGGERFVADPSERGWIAYEFPTLAAYCAALTRRVRFLNCVSIVPARSPLVQAKQWATLDQVSNGRAILGVGLGLREIDAIAIGYSFKERGEMTDEHVEAMKALWTQAEPSFHGKYVTFHDVIPAMRCVQRPHVPIWVTGNGGRASMRRAARLAADGWITNRGSPDDIGERIARMTEQMRAAGRDTEQMAFGMGLGIGRVPPGTTNGFYKYFPDEPVDTAEKAIDLIGRYAARGVNHISLRFIWESPKDFMGQMEWFASKVMPAFARGAPVGPVA